MSGEALERKLDLLIALTRVGVREELDAQLREIEADPVSRAILANTHESVSAGRLKAAVKKATGQSEPTIKRRLADLVSRGALERSGAGGAVSYRSTGLFDL